MTAIKRKAERGFVTDDEILAESRGRSGNDLGYRVGRGCSGVIASRALLNRRGAAALPQIDFAFRLIRFLIVTVADESQFRLVFIPGKFLVFAFARQQRYRRTVRL